MASTAKCSKLLGGEAGMQFAVSSAMSTKRKLLLEYGIVPNTNAQVGGWLPQIWTDGEPYYQDFPDLPKKGSVGESGYCCAKGLSRGEAWRSARASAFDLAFDFRAYHAGINVRALGCDYCQSLTDPYAPSHIGSYHCQSGSLASGGDKAHCTCDYCF